jgi:hypothetical protein
MEIGKQFVLCLVSGKPLSSIALCCSIKSLYLTSSGVNIYLKEIIVLQ